MPTGQRANAEGKEPVQRAREPVQRAREPVQRAREPVQPGKEANAKDHEPVPKGQDASATEPDARATESQTPPSKARCHHPSGEMPPPKDARCLHQRRQMPPPKQPEASPRANFRPAQNRYSSLLAVLCEAEEKINDKSANITPTIFFSPETKLRSSESSPSTRAPTTNSSYDFRTPKPDGIQCDMPATSRVLYLPRAFSSL